MSKTSTDYSFPLKGEQHLGSQGETRDRQVKMRGFDPKGLDLSCVNQTKPLVKFNAGFNQQSSQFDPGTTPSEGRLQVASGVYR